MSIRYGEPLWPGTSPRPGEDRSWGGHPDLPDWGRRRVVKLYFFAASSRVMGWSTCNLFYSLIIIIIIFYLPSNFRVALTANVSGHFNNTTAQWAKIRPQHRELRALLFAMNVWAYLHNPQGINYKCKSSLHSAQYSSRNWLFILFKI